MDCFVLLVFGRLSHRGLVERREIVHAYIDARSLGDGGEPATSPLGGHLLAHVERLDLEVRARVDRD